MGTYQSHWQWALVQCKVRLTSPFFKIYYAFVWTSFTHRWCSAKTAYNRILYVGNAEVCIYLVFLVKIAVGIDISYAFEVTYLPAVTVNKNAQQMHISVICTYNILFLQDIIDIFSHVINFVHVFTHWSTSKLPR